MPCRAVGEGEEGDMKSQNGCCAVTCRVPGTLHVQGHIFQQVHYNGIHASGVMDVLLIKSRGITSGIKPSNLITE